MKTHTTRLLTGDSSAFTVLLAPSREQAWLRSVLSRSNWDIRTASTVQEAVQLLRTSPVSVVLAPWSADNDALWRELLHEMDGVDPHPRLIVTDRHPDEYMWAEVLNLGGWDVLAQPFDSREALHVVSCACQSWYDEMSRTRSRAGHAA